MLYEILIFAGGFFAGAVFILLGIWSISKIELDEPSDSWSAIRDSQGRTIAMGRDMISPIVPLRQTPLD